MNIIGYTNKFSLTNEEELEVKVSCSNIKTYKADLVKIIQGDINEKGPGYKENKIDIKLGGPYKARNQKIPMGSYGLVKNNKVFNKTENILISVLAFPTLLKKKNKQTIISKFCQSTNIGFELFIDKKDNINFVINRNKIIIRKNLNLKKWHFIKAGYNHKTGTIFLSIRYYDENNQNFINTKIQKKIQKKKNFNNTNDLLIATNKHNKINDNFYNGKLESLKISIDKNISFFSKNNKSLLELDFSKYLYSDKIIDVSGNKLHGKLFNHPARAVTGFNWKESTRDWKNSPDKYSSIYFHEDDLTDCRWDTDFKFKIPKNIISGIYAIKLHNRKDEFYIPICVKPKIHSKKNKILFLMPTSSYLAYANNRIGIDVSETELVCGRLLELNDQDKFLQENPNLGLSFYDTHKDGSPVFYSSKRRPIINFQPKHIGALGGEGSNVWQFNADTHILGWLNHFNYDYDVICDSDLHKDGFKILKNYNVLITGTHPEYYSLNMIKGIEKFKNNGGRLIYLGGNGFYWRISYDKKSTDIIECRKTEGGIRATETHPGESYSSLTGEYTGLWRRNSFSPNKLVGVGMVAQGFDVSSSYSRTQQSYSKKVKFIFKGIKDKIIGDFGLSGGGAAGLEIDSYNKELGSPDNAIVLASSKNHTDLYLMTPEDLLDPVPGIGGTESEIIKSDIVFFQTKHNGAVFSVGSVAWGGSMAWNGYKNNISKITANVLNGFLNIKEFK